MKYYKIIKKNLYEIKISLKQFVVEISYLIFHSIIHTEDIIIE
jgi:hypothetical protein